MTYVMFDTVTVASVPSFANTAADAVAGYIDGRYADMGALSAAFPKAHHLSIAVRSSDVADCLDIETGDATPAEAAFWVRMAQAHHVWRPCLYADRSTMPQVIANLKAHGIARSAVRLWVADWTFTPHVPAGYDACQWTDRALGRNLDESLCLETFFAQTKPAADHPGGVASADVHLDFGTGAWTVHSRPGNITLGSKARRWEAKVGIDERTGAWTVTPLPFDEPKAMTTPTITPPAA
jgi:hypothetical protein